MGMCQEKTTRSDIPLDELRLKQKAEEEYYRGKNHQEGLVGRPLTDQELVAKFFTYHPPTPHTQPKFDAINQAAKNFAEIVLQNCPYGFDRSLAIKAIQYAKTTANQSIALNGLSL